MSKYKVKYKVDEIIYNSLTVNLVACINDIVNEHKLRKLEITEIKEVVWDD